MSVKLTRALDPRCDLEEDDEYAAMIGADNWVHYKFVPSSISNSKISWTNIKPAGEKYLISRKWRITYNLRVHIQDNRTQVNDQGAQVYVCDENSTEHPKLEKGKFGLRSFPLHSCTSEILLRLNNRDCKAYPQETLHARMQYWPNARLKTYTGFCPHQKCKSQKFSDMATFQNNFLAGFGDGDPYDSNNGEITGLTIVRNNDREAIFTCSIREPVMCDPLQYNVAGGYGKSMYCVSNLELNYYINNLAHMVCLDDTIPVTSVTCTLSDINLEIDVATPGFELPNMWTHGYTEFQIYKSGIGNVLPNAETKVTTGVYSLSFHPRSIYIFAARDTGDFNDNGTAVHSTDTFACITKLTITYANDTKLLADCSTFDLFHIAQNNGLQDTTFGDWGYGFPTIPKAAGAAVPATTQVGRVGSVFRCTPGIDLVTGKAGKLICGGLPAEGTNFQVEAQIRNINSTETINFSLYILLENCGILSLIAGGSDLDMAPIKDKAMIETAPLVKLTSPEIYGGGHFLDQIKKAGRWVKDNKILSRVAGIFAPRVGNALGALGLGFKPRKKRKRSGGAIRAGAINMPGGAILDEDDIFTSY